MLLSIRVLLVVMVDEGRLSWLMLLRGIIISARDAVKKRPGILISTYSVELHEIDYRVNYPGADLWERGSLENLSIES
jgi:hypothetical protein